MPELPEVETVRRGVAAAAAGRRIRAVHVGREDVTRGTAAAVRAQAGGRLHAVARHGKQLALVTDTGPAAAVHLGMSGTLTAAATGPAADRPRHVHVVWCLEGGLELRFRDPRRFGGVRGYADLAALRRERWANLGPDALTVGPADLHRRLGRTGRGLKAALLDQQLVAGLGNIYVDELLFGARLHPGVRACGLPRPAAAGLVRRMRTLLGRAVAAGGSSLRDHVGADGAAGAFQRSHRVYGRAGRPCRRCRTPLDSGTFAGRTTVWCPRCQPPGGR